MSRPVSTTRRMSASPVTPRASLPRATTRGVSSSSCGRAGRCRTVCTRQCQEVHGERPRRHQRPAGAWSPDLGQHFGSMAGGIGDTRRRVSSSCWPWCSSSPGGQPRTSPCICGGHITPSGPAARRHSNRRHKRRGPRQIAAGASFLFRVGTAGRCTTWWTLSSSWLILVRRPRSPAV